jgi:hypothetical protein
MLSDFKASIPKSSTTTTVTRKKTSISGFKVLERPFMTLVRVNYTSSSYKQVLANSGDRVLVFAYTNDGTGTIAYNPRNKTAGKISTDVLDNANVEPFSDSKLYMTLGHESRASFRHVEWKRGDYIRVWNREDESYSRSSGFCFVLTTGQIGRFMTQTAQLEAVE